jgi:hypothetical protein
MARELGRAAICTPSPWHVRAPRRCEHESTPARTRRGHRARSRAKRPCGVMVSAQVSEGRTPLGHCVERVEKVAGAARQSAGFHYLRRGMSSIPDNGGPSLRCPAGRAIASAGGQASQSSPHRSARPPVNAGLDTMIHPYPSDRPERPRAPRMRPTLNLARSEHSARIGDEQKIFRCIAPEFNGPATMGTVRGRAGDDRRTKLAALTTNMGR